MLKVGGMSQLAYRPNSAKKVVGRHMTMMVLHVSPHFS
jgi:hypothetical protein